ncbi:MAG: hypothetical protein ISS48_01510 [Candidatus Aenigmarchaeota archaeon]|nr:hypothetical protein [Candidatus Aenigmarchaeota archaeon]
MALAIEFTKLINKRVRKRMIVEGLIFSIFGGFFVVLLDPKNTLNAIIGAAWDRVLLSQLKGYFGNSRKDGI